MSQGKEQSVKDRVKKIADQHGRTFGEVWQEVVLELGLVRTRLRESRARELAILTSPAARSILEQHDIQLISYRELALTNA